MKIYSPVLSSTMSIPILSREKDTLCAVRKQAQICNHQILAECKANSKRRAIRGTCCRPVLTSRCCEPVSASSLVGPMCIARNTQTHLLLPTNYNYKPDKPALHSNRVDLDSSEELDERPLAPRWWHDRFASVVTLADFLHVLLISVISSL